LHQTYPSTATVKFMFGGGRGRPIAEPWLGRQPREMIARERQTRRRLASEAIADASTIKAEGVVEMGWMIVPSVRGGLNL
jgi:hypothetical protein